MPVYKDDKRGTYYFSVYVPLESGGTKRFIRRGFKSRPAARKAEAKFLLEYEEEQEKTITFEYVAKKYMKWYKRRRKESSYSKLESVMDFNVLPIFGHMDITKIRNRDIMEFHDDLIDKYSIRHAKRIHGYLSAVFNFAIKQEYVTVNPARNVGNIDIQEQKIVNYWTLEEFKQFLSVVEDDFYKTLFMTLYYSGMRKGELLALTWADIDLDNNIINIDKTVYNGNVTSPKTESSNRKNHMPKHVMLMLRHLKKSTKAGYVVFGDFYDHLATTTLDRHFHAYIKKSQVKKIRLHDFRHSHASYLINLNAMPSAIAKRLGHSDVATTLNTYSHLYPSTEKELVDLMESDFKTADVVQFKVK